MSQAIFPTLPGLTWDVKKTPTWSTKVQQSSSGKELRASYYSWPQYRYALTYDVLRQSNGLQELQTLAGFFNARQGKYDSFLFQDPNDNAVTLHGFGTGDGSTTTYQLQRTTAGPHNGDGLSGTLATATTGHSNFLLWSEAFDNAAWSKDTGVSVVANAIYSPLGTLAADKVVNAGTGSPAIFQITTQNAANGTPWTFSVWLRADAPTTVELQIQRAASSDIETSAPITLTTAWQRYYFTHSPTWTGTTAIYAVIRFLTTPGTIYAWGAQLEFATNGTTYIGTSSNAAGVSPNYWPATGDGFEPVYDVDYQTQIPAIYISGIAKTPGTDYTISSSGLVTFASAPPNGSALQWTGSYFWRCRFDLDAAEFNNFLSQLWDLKTLTFVTVK